MSRRKTKKRRYTQAQLEAKRVAKKQAKLFALQKNITIFALLIILILGLVSTTFSTSIFATLDDADTGTLIAQVQTAAKNKTELADTKANVDVANTGYDISSEKYVYYLTTWNSVKIHIWKDDSYYADYALTNIPDTDIWYYYFSGGWGGYAGFQFFTDNWTSKSNEFKQNVTDNTWFTSNASHKTLENMSGTAKVVTMISTDGGSTYTATANSSVYTTVSGYSVTTAATTATSVSENTKTASSSSIEAAYGSTITYEATATGATFKGFSTTTSSSTLPSMSSTSTTYTRTATANNASDNTTIYAYYIINTYTVSYDANNGTGAPSNQTKTYGTALTLSSTEPTREGYTFKNWNTSADGSGTAYYPGDSYTTNAATTLYAQWCPNEPSALTLTATNVVADTNGTGTESNPYIVYNGDNFTLTANATVPSGSTAYYSTTSGGTYSNTNTFTPATTTTGTAQSYSVYAKSYANSIYSTDYINATAYYMAFTHLSEATTGFTMSSDSITDAESVTLSGAYVKDVVDAEKTYITQSYQVSTDNSNFTDITGDTWSPDDVGTYYFRVKTTNTKTNEEVYSSSQKLTVTQSTVYYSINVSQTGAYTGTVTLKTGDDTISDNKILANSPLAISLSRRTATRYIDYVRVIDTSTKEILWETDSYINGDLNETSVIDHVKGDVTIQYAIEIKPYVQPAIPTNAASISFKYISDGKEMEGTTATTYYVDYGSEIRYSVTPKTGYYVQSMGGVTIGAITSSTVTGTKNNVTANVGGVTATLTANKTVTVSIDSTSASTDGASMIIGDTAVDFGTGKPLNYGEETTVIITPPEGCYAEVNGIDVKETIKEGGKAEFKVTLTGENQSYTVKFVKNPTIKVKQPTYGSIYITDSQGNFYLNGDSVVCGTTLNVHAIANNKDYYTINEDDVYYFADETTDRYALDKSDKLEDVWTYKIFCTSTVSATISGDDSKTDYFVKDEKQQQATISKYSSVTFNYTVTSGDYALSYEVVDTNGDEQPNDTVVARIANGTLTITPTSNINDCVLVKVSSSVTGTVKYYLIRINSFANTEHNELQKIYAINEAITLSGKFSSALKEIGYYISEDNVLFNKLTDDSSTKEDDAYSYSFSQTASGVKYYKITAKDTSGNEASVTQKAVFGTDSIGGTRNFYLLNKTDYDISKYSIRICFENESNDRVWASMQSVISDPQYYRATVPTDCNKVSIYLADPDKHLVVKSGEGNFNNVCYYYVEDQIELDSDSKNTIYEMTKFSKTSGMTLQLLQ